MVIDLQNASAQTHYTSDICIAGGGIAGLTLAAALQNSGLNVAILEGGGLAPEPRSQDLYRVALLGKPHNGVHEGRFRLFGGSSTQWGGQLLAYSPDVFLPPPSTGMPVWPITESDLAPYYPRVLGLFRVPAEPFDLRSLPEAPSPASNPDVNLRYSRWAPFTQRNLAHTLGKRALESKSTSVFLHANLTRIELHPSGNSVSRLHVANYSGRVFTFSARFFVLGLGTVESVRLLLASNIGNRHDQLGRYFHDHLGVHAVTLRGPARAAAIRLFAPEVHGRAFYTPKLEATPQWRAQNAAQSVMAHFPVIEPEDSPSATIRLILKSIQQRRLQPDLGCRRLLALPAGTLEILRLAWSTKVSKRRPISKHAEVRINIDVEQRPASESRIRLSDTLDVLGVPRAALDWKISQAEHQTVRRYAKTIQSCLAPLGIANLDVNPALFAEGEQWLSCAADTYHMMGGARLGSDPTQSVVDPHLQVHAIPNLFVASCAVFPSGGSSNPTFTLMALTLRLAETLRRLAAA